MLSKLATIDALRKLAKKHRKHTPIVSRQQQKLFGMVASGEKKLPGLSVQEAKEHLEESRGKKLPKRADIVDWYWPAILSSIIGGTLGANIGAGAGAVLTGNGDNQGGTIIGGLLGAGLGGLAGYNLYDLINQSKTRNPEMYTAIAQPIMASGAPIKVKNAALALKALETLGIL